MPVVTGQLQNPTKVRHDKGKNGPWESYHLDVVWASGTKKVQVGKEHMEHWVSAGKGDDRFYLVSYSGSYDRVDSITVATVDDRIKTEDTRPPVDKDTLIVRQNVSTAAHSMVASMIRGGLLATDPEKLSDCLDEWVDHFYHEGLKRIGVPHE